VDSYLDRLENTKQQLREQIQTVDEKRKAEIAKEIENIDDNIEETTEFRNELDNIINDGVEIDFDQGIWTHLKLVDEYNLLAVPVDKL
jgi:uncharacterized phage infection (PIP) family protein YhgE